MLTSSFKKEIITFNFTRSYLVNMMINFQVVPSHVGYRNYNPLFARQDYASDRSSARYARSPGRHDRCIADHDRISFRFAILIYVFLNSDLFSRQSILKFQI